VDVICICNADGEIRPLRLRLADERTGWVRVDIDQILRIDRDQRFGSESITFLCGAQIHDRRRIFCIKYAVRSHVWSILSS
jgi:hypothetical protein